MIDIAKYALIYTDWLKGGCRFYTGETQYNFHENVCEVPKENKDSFIAFNVNVSKLISEYFQKGDFTL